MKHQPTLETATLTEGSRVGHYLLWPVMALLTIIVLAGIYTTIALNRLLTWILDRI